MQFQGDIQFRLIPDAVTPVSLLFAGSPAQIGNVTLYSTNIKLLVDGGDVAIGGVDSTNVSASGSIQTIGLSVVNGSANVTINVSASGSISNVTISNITGNAIGSINASATGSISNVTLSVVNGSASTAVVTSSNAIIIFIGI